MDRPELPNSSNIPYNASETTPAIKMCLWSSSYENIDPVRIRAARVAARAYAAELRDALDQGMGEPSLGVEADEIEKHIDYLDDEYPV